MNDEINSQKERLVEAFFRIKKLVTSFPDNLGTHMRELDISMTEFTLMQAIRHNSLESKSNIDLTHVQKSLFITKSAISQMLGVLEKKGYINRDIDKANRRKLIVTLTEKGENALKCVEDVFDRRIERIIKQLGKEDTEQFIRSISKIGLVLEDEINNS